MTTPACAPLDLHAATRPPSVRRGLRRFRRDQRGTTAVEFALVSLPFFALLFAILETALAFWSQQVLETAVADASRQIYTGQFQQGAVGQTPEQLAERFRTDLCTRVKGLFDCNSMVKVDIATPTDFQSSSAALPIKDGAFDTSSFGYSNSRGGQIVVVRAAMEYPTFVSLLNLNQTNLKNRKRLIMAVAAFRNEPF